MEQELEHCIAWQTCCKARHGIGVELEGGRSAASAYLKPRLLDECESLSSVVKRRFLICRQSGPADLGACAEQEGKLHHEHWWASIM